eukprot:4938718-Amphidinium_carterae.1
MVILLAVRPISGWRCATGCRRSGATTAMRSCLVPKVEKNVTANVIVTDGIRFLTNEFIKWLQKGCKRNHRVHVLESQCVHFWTKINMGVPAILKW